MMNRLRCISALLPSLILLATTAAAQHPLNEADFLGYIQPRNSKDIGHSYWGVQAGSIREGVLERAAGLGVHWTRLGASWPSVEKVKGSYDWSQTDETFNTTLRYGITPFVTLGGGNPLYAGSDTYDDPALAELYGRKTNPPTANPEALEAWKQFVTAAVERYKDRITYWEIWNEPNHRAYWGAPPDGHDYGRLVKITGELIKRLQPDAVIVAGATAGLDPEFIDAYLSEAAPVIDIISFHQYGAIPEERIYRAVEVRKVIDKYNPAIPLWQGECGYPSHSSTRDFRGDSPWGLNIQAKWLLRQGLTDTYFVGATLSNYFILFHDGNRADRQKRSFLSPIDSVLGAPERGGSRVRTVGVNEKTLLNNPDMVPKPAYYAYQNLAALIDGRYKRAEIPTRIDVKDPEPFYGIGVDDAFPSVPLAASYKTDDGKYILAHWLPWHGQEYLPRYATVDLRAEGASFREPVLVDLLSGKVYALKGMRTESGAVVLPGLPLADYPFAVVERDMIGIIRERSFE